MPRWFAALVLLLIPLPAFAHNFIENQMDVVIWPNRILIDARLSTEEIAVAHQLGAAGQRISPAEFSRAVTAHGAYLLRHLKVRADGVELPGKVLSAQPPLSGFSGFEAGSNSFVLYHLEFTAANSPIQVVQLEQNVLSEFQDLRGGWQVAFALRFRQSNQESWEQDLLNQTQVAEFGCDWSQPTAVAPRARRSSTSVFARYLRLGIEHILTGFDHLLFVCALVLAVSSLWDLLKVITAFTLAHSITLTLSVLNIVHLPSRAVEPMIALSIIIVAVQNIASPRSSRGTLRLAVAFGFGLFHGLGFATDLKDAMTAMSAASLVAALVAFSIGVELGHQIVVLPLFAGLRITRRLSPAPISAYAMRWGSAAISLAGLYFLFYAIRGY